MVLSQHGGPGSKGQLSSFFSQVLEQCLVHSASSEHPCYTGERRTDLLGLSCAQCSGTGGSLADWEDAPPPRDSGRADWVSELLERRERSKGRGKGGVCPPVIAVRLTGIPNHVSSSDSGPAYRPSQTSGVFHLLSFVPQSTRETDFEGLWG